MRAVLDPSGTAIVFRIPKDYQTEPAPGSAVLFAEVVIPQWKRPLDTTPEVDMVPTEERDFEECITGRCAFMTTMRGTFGTWNYCLKMTSLFEEKGNEGPVRCRMLLSGPRVPVHHGTTIEAGAVINTFKLSRRLPEYEETVRMLESRGIRYVVTD